MLINIPIESLEERYSAQWNRQIPKQLKQLGIDHRTIYPTTWEGEGTINVGEFLDVFQTHIFKSAQLVSVIRLIQEGHIKDGDVLFFHDLWFPGIEALFYIRDATGIKFKITGMLHAGTYDPNDFLTRVGMKRWAHHCESAWFSQVDAIFVATVYHKQLVEFANPQYKLPIYVTGLPLYRSGMEFPTEPVEKENIVVFPHRLAPEKQPEVFRRIAEHLQDKLKGWQFIFSKEVCKTKAEYYHLLARSKISVSCALQETWGIAMQESVFAGCIPLVPDRLSYAEMYPRLMRYQFDKHLAESLLSLCKEPQQTDLLLKLVSDIGKAFETRATDAIPAMVRIMRSRLGVEL